MLLTLRRCGSEVMVSNDTLVVDFEVSLDPCVQGLFKHLPKIVFDLRPANGPHRFLSFGFFRHFPHTNLLSIRFSYKTPHLFQCLYNGRV